MQDSLLVQGGKRGRLSLDETSESHGSKRLFITDRKSKCSFLIDSGADVSAIPPTRLERTRPACRDSLFAANGSSIPVYGYRNQTLDLGLRRLFTFKFVVANVSKPIVGADFLYTFNLLPDLRNKKLADGTTRLTTPGSLRSSNNTSIHVIAPQTSDRFSSILKQYPALLTPPSESRPVLHNVKHRIDFTGQPVCCRARRLRPEKLVAAKRHVNDLLQSGIIRPSKSNYASPLHMAQKGDDWRPCGDYRLLNLKTKHDCYPVPHMADFASTIHGSRVFSKIDLVKAFHQIPMAEEDIEKTAIITPFGLFEYTRMPFGLRNAAQTFQRSIDEVVRGLPFVYCYIDDLLVASPDPETHENHLHTVFERLNRYGIAISPAKCEFGVPKLVYLGHIVDQNGIAPEPEKVKAIRQTELPKTTSGLRRFLGMVNFYRRFIPHAADTMSPLNELLKSKEKDVKWSDRSRQAFEETKAAIADAALLHHPQPGGRLILLTDASDVAVGAALNEAPDGKEGDPLVADRLRPLSFFSRKLSSPGQKYSAFDKELLAVYLAIRYFRHYLEASEFIIYTDYKPLTYALSRATDKYTPRQERQLDFIAQYTCDIRYVKGEANVVADALSRPGINAIQADSATPGLLDLAKLAAEQQKDPELQLILATPASSSLKLEQVPCSTSAGSIWADVSHGKQRLFVPKTMRKDVFHSLHDLSHPSRRATRRLLCDRFVWPSINHDSADWAKACIQCQRSKITRHTNAPVGSFATVDRRFSHVHIDIVGPLPVDAGSKYLLTAIDRTSRWPEAWPIPDITAETIADALVANWVCGLDAHQHSQLTEACNSSHGFSVA